MELNLIFSPTTKLHTNYRQFTSNISLLKLILYTSSDKKKNHARSTKKYIFYDHKNRTYCFLISKIMRIDIFLYLYNNIVFQNNI